MSYHERFDKEFPELVSMSDGTTYRNVCDRQKVLAFIDEEISSARGKATWDGMDMGRKEERAALIAHVEGMRQTCTYHDEYTSGCTQCILVHGANGTLADILSYLREPDQVRKNGENQTITTPQFNKSLETGLEPDASQGCCKKCLDFTFQEGNMVCVDEDCPCHNKGKCSKKTCCTIQYGEDAGVCMLDNCPCHSPQGDKAEELVKHMTNRFLMWRLPENFRPDAGITFKRMEHNGKHYPMPVGTNLFDATQAEAMVRYMLDGSQNVSCPK